MSGMKRITDLTDYTSIIPYASELFGVYQPMIGWRSKRQKKRRSAAFDDAKLDLIHRLSTAYTGVVDLELFSSDCATEISRIAVGQLSTGKPRSFSGDPLLNAIAERLPRDRVADENEFIDALRPEVLDELLSGHIAPALTTQYSDECMSLRTQSKVKIDDQELIALMVDELGELLRSRLNAASAMAGALVGLVESGQFETLRSIFYSDIDQRSFAERVQQLLKADDPFETFDPTRDYTDASLSPLGIVHLFRQYFFELDTFLGTPTGHVWMSPGAAVELIEVSTRRTYVERIVEIATQTRKVTESSVTQRDELSEAVKEDNRNDLKLGASLTVNQSWGSGSATATGSLDMTTTQSTARESAHKRMREQSEKLTTEITQSYKSTFKTVTETTDTSSKRYSLTNSTDTLINYELRRKMRQVGVQVQDVGTYLSWQTFVDEPGRALGLGNLVHIAKPADLQDAPDTTETPIPPDVPVQFTANLVWDFDDMVVPGPDGFKELTTVSVPPGPPGYQVKYPDSIIEAFQVSASGEDFTGVWAFKGKLIGSNQISLGVAMAPRGMHWDERVNFVVTSTVLFTPSETKRKEIDDANKAKLAAGLAATEANQRQTHAAYIDAAKARIEAAGEVTTRKNEDLREEERIVVYRELIRALMSEALYRVPDGGKNDEMRHTMSELINAIFDVDKMLYFVAPEWWKPRVHAGQQLGAANNADLFASNFTSWSDLAPRKDNYFITEKSAPARLGSSLGWLLQLDGDDLRNAFLNAPWVKAVIPVRPGKEKAAMNWLQLVGVEGTDGIENLYAGTPAELDAIRTDLGVTDVTIKDAIMHLCNEVSAKHAASLVPGRYPKTEINDDNKVSAMPTEKVYEHGFYPLKGGFRAKTSEPFEVFDQWIEVLPTDQVVPVPVTYDPKTGRQLP